MDMVAKRLSRMRVLKNERSQNALSDIASFVTAENKIKYDNVMHKEFYSTWCSKMPFQQCVDSI